MLRKTVAILRHLFNWKLMLVSALFNGPLALLINVNYGSTEYLHAGGWQMVASALLTGFTGRLVQHFSALRSPILAYALGSVIPATATFFGSLPFHWFNGTPELFLTCLGATAISFGTSFVTNFGTRRRWKWLQP